MKIKAYFIALALIWAWIGFSNAKAQELDPLKDYRYTGSVQRDASGATARSAAVIAAFKRQWACPATSLHSGACAGWAIDHIVPLDCGGADAVFNMQWLPDSIKSAKGPFTKDHFERRVYGGHALSVGCPWAVSRSLPVW